MSLLISPAIYTPPSVVNYSPGNQYSANLEPNGKTITATAEASGTANADYSCSLALPLPGDSRLVLNRIATCAEVYVNSLSAGNLHLRVYVDQQDAAHLLIDTSFSTTGDQFTQADVIGPIPGAGYNSTLFPLLTDGSAHTFYFFFWCDAGDTANIGGASKNVGIVSLGVGAGFGANIDLIPCLFINITGIVSAIYSLTKYGGSVGPHGGVFINTAPNTPNLTGEPSLDTTVINSGSTIVSSNGLSVYLASSTTGGTQYVLTNISVTIKNGG